MKCFKILLLTSFVLLLSVSAFAADYNFVVITESSNPEKTISARFLKDLLTGRETRWSNRQTAQVFIPSRGSAVHEVSEQINHTTSAQLQMYWKKQLFTGTGKPPIMVRNDDSAIASVAMTPWSISVIEKSSITQDVKVLSIR